MTTRAIAGSILWLLSLIGCGASSASPQTDDTSGGEACDARMASDALESELAACHEAHPAEPPWSAQASYDAVFEQVRAHLGSTSEPREVTSEEAQPIADAIWALLDELTFTAQTESLRARAEDAAEGLLRDRDRDHSVAAAHAAFDAVTSIRATLHPPAPDPCADAAARADAARAQAARLCLH